MPSFSRISHTSFSSRDADGSARWWSEVFGLSEVDRVQGEGWRGIVLVHPPSATILEFQQHDANEEEWFEPRRTGLDHVGFKVDDRAHLDEWKVHFERLGVTHSPIADEAYGSVLTFKDPDGIQFEMFYRENHP